MTAEPLVRIWAGTAVVHALLQEGEIHEHEHATDEVTILPACRGIAPRTQNVYRVTDRSLMPASAALAMLRERRAQEGSAPHRGRACRRCLARLEAVVGS